MSSLPAPDTFRLARDLEGFRATVEFALGETLPRAPVRTLVYAFDGRGFSRPYAVRGQPAFFLPRLRGPVIVLRGGGGWRIDATVTLRHHLAHYFVRNGKGLATPLWYDEGFAHFASTTEVLDGRANIGVPHDDHVRLLRGKPRVPVRRVLEASDETSWGGVDRKVFDATSWAFLHYLELGRPGRRRTLTKLDHYVALTRDGRSPDYALETAFGASAFDLDKAIARYVRRDDFDTLAIRLPDAAAGSAARPVPGAEVSTRLGWLALALGRPERAREDFTKAIREDPGAVRAQVGLGRAFGMEQRWEEARTPLAIALRTGSGDALTQLDVAEFYRARATQTADAQERGQLLALARQHYRQSLAIDASIPETHVGLARTHFLPGESPEAAWPELERAARLMPSSLLVELERARLHLAAGRPASARRVARVVLTRSHSTVETAAAQQILDELTTGERRGARLPSAEPRLSEIAERTQEGVVVGSQDEDVPGRGQLLRGCDQRRRRHEHDHAPDRGGEAEGPEHDRVEHRRADPGDGHAALPLGRGSVDRLVALGDVDGLASTQIVRSRG
ncbi:MAG: tetratricopeptide repeat protein [Myxococcota bacterium]|nr:tetratricopeptide repeat protein [Myxococcota bacterium]